jgi:ATP-binding cassette subfamily F protein uup
LEQRFNSLQKPVEAAKGKSVSSAAEQRQLKKDLVRVERQIQKAKEKVAELESALDAAAFSAEELIKINADLEAQRSELNTREEEWLEITVQLDQ